MKNLKKYLLEASKSNQNLDINDAAAWGNIRDEIFAPKRKKFESWEIDYDPINKEINVLGIGRHGKRPFKDDGFAFEREEQERANGVGVDIKSIKCTCGRRLELADVADLSAYCTKDIFCTFNEPNSLKNLDLTSDTQISIIPIHDMSPTLANIKIDAPVFELGFYDFNIKGSIKGKVDTYILKGRYANAPAIEQFIKSIFGEFKFWTSAMLPQKITRQAMNVKIADIIPFYNSINAKTYIIEGRYENMHNKWLNIHVEFNNKSTANASAGSLQQYNFKYSLQLSDCWAHIYCYQQ